MHEHTRHRRTWIKNPRNWVWGSYTSPSGKYRVWWRGPFMLSVFTYWEHDHPDEELHGCGVSFLIGGVSE